MKKYTLLFTLFIAVVASAFELKLVPYEHSVDGNKINGHEAVDLGLNVKWASCNIGAENPEDFGDFFAWAEVAPKDVYNRDNCESFERSYSDLYSNPSCDAAATLWGGTWRMPTKRDMEQLLYRCTWEWITQNGVNGYKVIGPNGNSIFLPACGYKEDGHYLANETGYYWTSIPGDLGWANMLYLRPTIYKQHIEARSVGMTIRPVTE